MTTALDLIEETRRHLLAASRPELNRLDGAATSGATTLTLEQPVRGLQQGAMISVGLELFYVWSVSGQVATVQRGWAGSAAAAHDDGAVVEVNPRFPVFHVLSTLNAELRAYSSPAHGLYRVASVEITYNAARSGYDLNAPGMIGDPLAVEGTGVLPGDRDSLRRWRVIRDADTGDFASGAALYLYEGVLPGRDIRVTYRKGFDPLVTLADDVLAVTGLPTSAHDIPPLGAAARLLAGREARRSQLDAQPEPRAAQDVPPGSALTGARSFLALRDTRLNEEAARLAAAWPALRRQSA